MKISKTSLSFAAIMLAMTLCVISCKKKETATPEDSDTSSASDNNFAQKTSNDIMNVAGQASDIAVGDSLNSYRLREEEDVCGSSCAVITRDSVNRKITITFSGGTCLDGHVRSGSLTLDYSGSATGARYYRHPGFKCVVTSTNYVVDGNQVNIVNKTITNTTPAGFDPKTTNETWSISSNINIVKAAGGGTISFTSTKVKTLLNTSDSTVYRGSAVKIMWSKARIGITGSESGTTASSESFSASITSQLVRDMTCSPNAAYPGHHPFIQGAIDFTPGSKATRHLDYGSGTCDDQATVTINGKSYTISIK